MTAYPALMVTGGRGQLGTDLMSAAAAAGLTAKGFGSADLDITDASAVDAAVVAFAGDHALGVVINAAAYTAVDKAESESERAYLVNETGARNVATACARNGFGLVQVSTDYVFPGDGTRPYEPDDETGPRSVYGASKLAGERAVLEVHPAAHVVRTAWVWGATGANFVKTMAALEASKPEISVVDDQRGTPGFAADLAPMLRRIAVDRRSGIIHLDEPGRGDLVRVRRADRPRPRPRPGARSSYLHRRARPATAGTVAGQQRPRQRVLPPVCPSCGTSEYGPLQEARRRPGAARALVACLPWYLPGRAGVLPRREQPPPRRRAGASVCSSPT